MTWLWDRLAKRIDARPLGVTRIALGIAALLMTIELADSVGHVTDGAHLQIPVIPGTDWMRGFVATALAAWLVGAILFTIGLWTRPAGMLLVAASAFLFLADQQLYSNHLLMLTAFIGLTTLADGGAALSVDARRRGAHTVPAWPVWLVMAQLTTVYVFSAISKLNPSFLSGSVLASYFRSDGILALPDSWRSFQLMFAISVAVICLELFVAIGLWLPYWRRNAFVAGLALHAGILATYEAPHFPLLVFGVASLAPYVLFLNAAPASKLVIWDRSCDFCQMWIRWGQRLDWLGVLRYAGNEEEDVLAAHAITREAADEALHLVDGDGIHVGYDAVRRAAEVLPLTFLWAPLLGLPPVRWVGHRVYRRVARNRKCTIPRPEPAT